MAKKRDQKAFDEAIEKTVEILMEEVHNRLKKRAWKRAYVETMWPPSGPGTGGLQKFRIELPKGSLISDMFTPIQAALIIDEAWRLQKSLFLKTWYGIAVRFHPNGSYETEYNFDPDCIENDTTFLDS